MTMGIYPLYEWRREVSISGQKTRSWDITALVDQITREIRTISYLLHPPLLHEADLQSPLQWYVDGFGERSNISTNLELPSNLGRLSPEKQHARTFRTVNADAKKNEPAPVKPFVLYSFQHTFLTRLGRSGCYAWTLARIAGHSSISISSRYVHPSEDTVLAAFSRLGGHNSGHIEFPVMAEENREKLLSGGDMYN
jgi:integrase